MIKKLLFSILPLLLIISIILPLESRAATSQETVRQQISALTSKLATIYNLLAGSTDARVVNLRSRLDEILQHFGYQKDTAGIYATSSNWSLSTSTSNLTGNTASSSLASNTTNPNSEGTNQNSGQNPEQSNQNGAEGVSPQATSNGQPPSSSDPTVDKGGYDQRRDLEQTPQPQLADEELAKIQSKCRTQASTNSGTASVSLAIGQPTEAPMMCLVKTDKKTEGGNPILALMMYKDGKVEQTVMAVSGIPSKWSNYNDRLISGSKAPIPDGIYRAGHSEGSSLPTTDRKKIPLEKERVGGNRDAIVIHERLNGATSGCVGVWNAEEMRKVMKWVDGNLGQNKSIPLYVYLKD